MSQELLVEVGALEESDSCEPSVTCASLNVDCEFGHWTSWSACSVTCGTGQRYHTRTVIVHAQASGHRCDGGMEEVQSCTMEPCGAARDCSYTEWSTWSDCSRNCGGGHRSRSRDVWRTAKNGGAECPEADLEETGVCNTQDCIANAWGKIDCTWSTWSSWRSCSTSCGMGEARRTRIIVQQAAHSGQPCSGFYQEFRKCQDKPCEQKDCQFSAWEYWSSCSD
ncbi:adt-2, partial [Symbiodinium sp. CCMP2456]